MRALGVTILICTLSFIGSAQNFWNPIPYPDSTKAYAMNVEHDEYIFYSNWRDPDGIYRSDSEIIDWEFTGTGYYWTFDMAFNSNNTMFWASAHCILRSDDLGVTFDTVMLSIANIVSIEIDEYDGIWVGYPGGISLSTDDGITWDSVLIVDNHELFFDFAFGLNDEIYTVSTHWTAPGGGFYKSLDYGTTWINTGLSGNPAKTVAVNSIGDIFVGCHYTGLFLSTDNGETWENIKSDIDCETIVIDNEDKVYCGNAGQNWVHTLGVHMSDDYGETWETINTGLINKHVWNLYLDSENFLYALSAYDYGNQLYKSNNPIVTIEDNSHSFTPMSAYPNPFTTSTTIEYELTKPSPIQISIYNAIGESILQADKGVMPPGKHTFTWTPERLPEGLYIVEVAWDEYRVRRKLIVQ